MKNVTISLDEKAARWARIEAAKAGTSMARWVGALIEREMAGNSAREAQVAAMKAFLDGPGFPGISEDLPSRDELYDRPALRRHEHTGIRPGSARSRKAGKS